MASTRIVIGIVVTAASSLVALAACSGSTTSTGTGDGGASLGSSGSSGGTSGVGGGGSSGGGGTSGGGTSGGSALKLCPAGSTCTDAENATYNSCVQDKCDATFTKCYGADYKNGTFGGDCGSYITCTQACACGDNACLAKCTFTDACKSCVLPAVSNCAGMCEAPACVTGGSSGSSGTSGGGGTKSCADLKACCDKIPAGQLHDQCNATYDAVKSMESSCNAVYAGYAPSCP